MSKATLNKSKTLKAFNLKVGEYGLVINCTKFNDVILLKIDNEEHVCISTGTRWGPKCGLEVVKLKKGDIVTIKV